MTNKVHASSVHVVHRLPHRTRLRVPKVDRTPKKMTRLSESLASVPGVRSVEVNHATGSVVVKHEDHPGIMDGFATALAETGSELLLGLVGGEELGLAEVGLSFVGNFIKDTVSSVDKGLSSATSGTLDLRALVPLLFFGAGAFSLTRSRGDWAAVPPLVLFYYAFDTYWKFHTEASRQPQVAAIAADAQAGQ